MFNFMNGPFRQYDGGSMSPHGAVVGGTRSGPAGLAGWSDKYLKPEIEIPYAGGARGTPLLVKKEGVKIGGYADGGFCAWPGNGSKPENKYSI